MIWGQDVEPIKKLMDDALEYFAEKDDGLVSIYELHEWGIGWKKC